MSTNAPIDVVPSFNRLRFVVRYGILLGQAVWGGPELIVIGRIRSDCAVVLLCLARL